MSFVKLDPGSRGFIVMLAALTALTALSIDVSLPAMPQLAQTFTTSADRVQLTLSLFLVGFAFGQLFYGPLSDGYGRRPLLLAGIGIYSVASLGCMLAGSIDQLIAFRVLQGMGACIGRVMTPVIVRDYFDRQRGAQLLSYTLMVMSLAPLLGPIIGGWLLVLFGWRSIFSVLLVAGVAVFAATWALMPESNKSPDPAAARPVRIMLNYVEILRRPDCLLFGLVGCAVFAGMFCYISASPFVVIEVLGVATENYGFVFACTALALIAGATTNTRLLPRLGPDRVMVIGLVALCTGGVTLLICAFFQYGGVLGIILPMLCYIFAIAIVTPNATASAMEPLPRMAGQVSSVLGFMQMIGGAIMGFLVNRFYDHSAMPMAIGVFSMSLMATLAFLIARRGRRRNIRE